MPRASVATVRDFVRKWKQTMFETETPGMPEQPIITERMQNQVRRWEAVADARATFLSCYSLMTGNTLLAIEAGEFHDAKWVHTLMHRFADYYFDALEVYE